MVSRLKDLFYVPKHGKVSEKTVLVRMAVSIGCILFYLAAISITAYAYFSHSASTAVMTMRSAHYALEITAPADVSPTADEVYVLQNATDVEASYEFKLHRISGENYATVGFCTVKVKTDVAEPEIQHFYTAPIGTYVENGQQHTQEERSVIIPVPAGKTAYVTFVAELGTCTHEAIAGEEIALLYAPVEETPGPVAEEEEETVTTTTTTTTATTAPVTTTTTQEEPETTNTDEETTTTLTTIGTAPVTTTTVTTQADGDTPTPDTTTTAEETE